MSTTDAGDPEHAASPQNGEGGRRSPVDFVSTGPGTLAGRYLRLFWQPVFRVDDMEPGRSLPLHVLGEGFTLYRGESGSYHVVAFRCAHRGSQLSTGWVEGDCIRCFYHGWRYDETGRCVERPAEADASVENLGIRAYPTREYLGLVFAYLGEGEAPEFPRYPLFEGDGVLMTETFPRGCNYFQDLENGVDEVHVNFAHEEGFRQHQIVKLPRITAEETEFGMIQYGHREGEPDRHNLFHMPNILQVSVPPLDEASGWLHALRWRVPITDDASLSFAVDYSPVTGEAARRLREKRAERERKLEGMKRAHEVARDILEGKYHVRDVMDHPEIIRIQDDVAQAGQGRMVDRSQEHLGRSDRAVFRLRKIWERELRALAEGRPLTEWKHSEHVESTSGAASRPTSVA